MVKIILTADRTLIANYEVLLEGILGTVSTTYVPKYIYNRHIAPKLKPNKDGSINNPPYGLRKLEAALISSGFKTSDIEFVHPEHLLNFKNDCKIIGITSGDPLGLGMTSTTMDGVMGGELYTKLYFKKVAAKANEIKKTDPEVKICYGGPGGWQFLKKKDMISKLGIDHVFLGFGDRTIPTVFKEILEKKTIPQIIHCDEPEISEIKETMGPSSMGVVEIGRFCGRGCRFCTMRDKTMLHIPKKIILSEIRTNLKHGVRNISTLSEDFLRYGASGIRPDEKKVLDLFESIAKIPGLRLVQLDHVNIASVACVNDSILAQIHDSVALHKPNDWVWLNAGIETASPRLLKELAPGKAKPFNIDEWPDYIKQTIGRLNDAGFMPFLSIVLGAPKETEEDILKTQELLDDIKSMRTALFPIFYVGVADGDRSFLVDNMKPYHWKLFRDAYEMNFKWVPRLFSKNQKAGGVRFGHRFMTQFIGRIGVVNIRRKIKKLSRGENHRR